MRVLKAMCWTCVLALGVAPGSQARAGYVVRQYYSGWYKGGSSYYYRHYYYKPTPEYAGYKYNYVVYYPKYPKYYYYYSPYTKQFWGRCPVDAGGKAAYSFLKPEARPMPGPVGEEPPQAAFPKEGGLPPIPKTADEQKQFPDDREKLDLPPENPPPRVAGSPN
jgi:hypothetical protein